MAYPVLFAVSITGWPFGTQPTRVITRGHDVPPRLVGGLPEERVLDRSDKSTPLPSDADLMAAVGTQQGEALQELYNRYFVRGFALAARILGDPSTAEDCAHDVFLKVWQKPHLYDPRRGAFVHWFLAAVHNSAINQLRARQRTQPLAGSDEKTDGDERPTPEPGDRRAGESSVEDLLGQAETQRIVRAALAELSPPQRAALELAYFRGMSQSEIAAYLQEPLGTVKTRMRTGMLKLRAALEAQGWGKDVRFG